MQALIQKTETLYLRYAFESTLCLHARNTYILGHFAWMSVQEDDVVFSYVCDARASVRFGDFVFLDEMFELLGSVSGSAGRVESEY